MISTRSYPKKTYTLNFDGSHNNQEEKMSAGCIIRDSSTGELVVAVAYNLTNTPTLASCNVAIAEALGLCKGLKLAQQNNLKLKLVKGDSKEVIDHVLGRARRLPGLALSGIIAEIKGMLDQDFTKFRLIDRSDNKVADRLASMGSYLMADFKIFTKCTDLPTQVIELINQEKVMSSRSSITEVLKWNNDGEGSSTAGDIGTAAVVAGGLGLLAWGFSKLFSDSDDTSSASVATKAPRTTWNSLSNNTFYQDDYPKSRQFYTLQYFGSDRNQLQKARAGCIIRNKQGELLVAAAYNLDNQYPNFHIAIAEAIALKNGLQLAKKYDVKFDIIQGRNKEVRDRVLGQPRPPKLGELSKLVQQIKDCLKDVLGIAGGAEDTLQLVREDEIEVARELAIIGGTLGQESEIYESVDDLPHSVAVLV